MEHDLSLSCLWESCSSQRSLSYHKLKMLVWDCICVNFQNLILQNSCYTAQYVKQRFIEVKTARSTIQQQLPKTHLLPPPLPQPHPYAVKLFKRTPNNTILKHIPITLERQLYVTFFSLFHLQYCKS